MTTQRGTQARRERVEAIIRERPGIMVKEVAAALRVRPRVVYGDVAVLAAAGRVRRFPPGECPVCRKAGVLV